MRDVLSKIQKKNRAPRTPAKRCEGPSIENLKKICLDAGSSIADFDRAIKDLDPHGLIRTGTLDGIAASSNRDAWFAPAVNSNEHAYLNEDGYKKAERLDHSFAERKARIEPSFGKSFPQHREPREFGTLPAEAPEVAFTGLEAELALAVSDSAGSRRVKALQLVQFNMNRLRGQMSSSCKILNDLRALHRLLLLEERALAEEFRQAAG